MHHAAKFFKAIPKFQVTTMHRCLDQGVAPLAVDDKGRSLLVALHAGPGPETLDRDPTEFMLGLAELESRLLYAGAPVKNQWVDPEMSLLAGILSRCFHTVLEDQVTPGQAAKRLQAWLAPGIDLGPVETWGPDLVRQWVEDMVNLGDGWDLSVVDFGQKSLIQMFERGVSSKMIVAAIPQGMPGREAIDHILTAQARSDRAAHLTEPTEAQRRIRHRP